MKAKWVDQFVDTDLTTCPRTDHTKQNKEFNFKTVGCQMWVQYLRIKQLAMGQNYMPRLMGSCDWTKQLGVYKIMQSANLLLESIVPIDWEKEGRPELLLGWCCRKETPFDHCKAWEDHRRVALEHRCGSYELHDRRELPSMACTTASVSSEP